MVDSASFREWLRKNTSLGPDSVTDTISRIRRADRIREWDNEPTYIFFLERDEAFACLSVSVKSQIRKAVRLYEAFAGNG